MSAVAVSAGSEQDAGMSRYHALDSLRAAMMLLGLALHSAMPYIHTYSDVWPFKDRHTSPVFDLFVYYVHVFRMPAFFVMAGFFGALLANRRGTRELVVNRAHRILVPLVVGWLLLFPLNTLGFEIGKRFTAPPAPEAPDMSVDHGGSKVLMHLWFLYYLAVFYAAAVPLSRLAARWRRPGLERAAQAFRAALESPRRASIFAIPTALTLLPMHMGILETQPSLTPAPKILVAYGIFFAFGWLLFRERDLLPRFIEGAPRHLLYTLPLYAVALACLARMLQPAPVDAVASLVLVVANALICWLCIFGLLGLFLRWLDRPSFTGRYLADASYWLYLTHVPFTIWLPIGLAGVPLPVALKYVLVLLVTLTCTLLTYDLCVRDTAIGATLNGRRYPAVLPTLLRGKLSARSGQPADSR